MLARQRQALILDELRRTGGVRVSELTDLLGVSDMTIRRDLEQLAADGVAAARYTAARSCRATSPTNPASRPSAMLEQPAKQRDRRAGRRPGQAGHRDRAVRRDDHLVDGPAPRVRSPGSPSSRTRPPSPTRSPRWTPQPGRRSSSPAASAPPAPHSSGRSPTGRSARCTSTSCSSASTASTPAPGSPRRISPRPTTNRALISSAREVIVLADSTKWGLVGLADFGPLSSAQHRDHRRWTARRRPPPRWQDAVDEVILVAPAPDTA